MSRQPVSCPLGLDDLLDYLLGELDAERAEAVEDHLFACSACADRLAALERLGASVADLARHAGVAANVNTAFLERAARDGVTMREYRIGEGEAVPCSTGPEDLWVVRLAADFGDLRDFGLDAELHDLERGEVTPLPGREVVVDRDRGEVILVFPGEVVRGYPRSRWTMRLRGEGAGGPVEIGTFVMDHTP